MLRICNISFFSKTFFSKNYCLSNREKQLIFTTFLPKKRRITDKYFTKSQISNMEWGVGLFQLCWVLPQIKIYKSEPNYHFLHVHTHTQCSSKSMHEVIVIKKLKC